MRPDQDPRLVSMGKGEPTCEKCMMELYSDASDSICNDCALKPAQGSDEMKELLDKSIDREFSGPISESIARAKKMHRL